MRSVLAERADERPSACVTGLASGASALTDRADIRAGQIREAGIAVGHSIAAADRCELRRALARPHGAEAFAAASLCPAELTDHALRARGAARRHCSIAEGRRVHCRVDKRARSIDSDGAVWVGEAHIGGERIATCTGIGLIRRRAARKKNCEDCKRAIEVIHRLIVHPGP